MIVVMAVGLYTVRAILSLLGVVDYGIYNVVGGVVSMFSFINGTLATSSQRYFSIELAEGDLKRLNQWFCLNITTFSLLIAGFVVIAETLGLWFVNTQMTIPAERMFAANVVYQLSIVTFCVHFFAVPYNALIIAHERMSAFAYISIVEALLKLAIVFFLSVISWDRLIVYGILMFLTSCGITSSYIIYNLRHFSESRYRPYWNITEVKELIGFSGWHFLGTFSVVVRSQCINILLNLFFNPAVNAARAIAYQIYAAIGQLSSNFFVAVKPQMYKSYASGELDELYRLILRSTIICTFLVSILVFPVLANTPYILGLWLKEVPEYAVVFTQLVLINGLIDSSNGCTIAPALATGKIGRFQVITSIPFLLNLPVSYVVLRLGADPTATMIISIIFSLVTAILRAWLLKDMIGFSFGRYAVLFMKLMVASCLIFACIHYSVYNLADSLISLILWSLLICLLTLVVYVTMIVSPSDMQAIVRIIRKR